MVKLVLLLQEQHNSGRGHTQDAPKVPSTDSMTRATPALSANAAEALAASTTAAHASSPAPKQSAAASIALDVAPQQQACASTPALLPPTAAAGLEPDQGLLGNAGKALPSVTVPEELQAAVPLAIADSQGGADEAGLGSSGVVQPDQAALGGTPGGQAVQQVTKDDVMVEATEAADQLPLSYPATLVATLPCTMPAWLVAHSQRTAATAVVATQLAPTQVAQPSVKSARVPDPSAHTVALTKCLLPSTSTGRMLSHPGGPPPQDRPQTRLVSRLTQLGEAASEAMPDQATAGSPSAAFTGPEQSGRKHARRSGQAQAAHRAGLPRAAPGELSAKAAEGSSAANCQAAQPDEAGAAGSSPGRQAADRGKRAAECSPGPYDACKAPHKRARSDSPIAKQDWLRDDMHGARCRGPSDADVQVGAVSDTWFVSVHVIEALPLPLRTSLFSGDATCIGLHDVLLHSTQGKVEARYA